MGLLLLCSTGRKVSRKQDRRKFLISKQDRDGATKPNVRSKGIGQRLKWARQRAELTVRDVARATGVSPSTISDTELERRVPRADTLEKLAVALKVEPSWLAFGDGMAPSGYASASSPGPR